MNEETITVETLEKEPTPASQRIIDNPDRIPLPQEAILAAASLPSDTFVYRLSFERHFACAEQVKPYSSLTALEQEELDARYGLKASTRHPANDKYKYQRHCLKIPFTYRTDIKSQTFYLPSRGCVIGKPVVVISYNAALKVATLLVRDQNQLRVIDTPTLSGIFRECLPGTYGCLFSTSKGLFLYADTKRNKEDPAKLGIYANMVNAIKAAPFAIVLEFLFMFIMFSVTPLMVWISLHTQPFLTPLVYIVLFCLTFGGQTWQRHFLYKKYGEVAVKSAILSFRFVTVIVFGLLTFAGVYVLIH